MSKNLCLYFSMDFQNYSLQLPEHHFVFFLPSLPLSSQTHMWPRMNYSCLSHELTAGSPVDCIPMGDLSRTFVAGIWLPPPVHSLSLCLSFSFLISLPSSIAFLLFCYPGIHGHSFILWHWAGLKGFVLITPTFPSFQSFFLTLPQSWNHCAWKGRSDINLGLVSWEDWNSATLDSQQSYSSFSPTRTISQCVW